MTTERPRHPNTAGATSQYQVRRAARYARTAKRNQVALDFLALGPRR